MPASKKPFRTIKDSYKTGRFSREEVRAAILAALRERGELPMLDAKRDVVREHQESGASRRSAA